MKAGVYTRLSRLKATEELTTLGLERQSEDTLKLAKARGWEVVRTYSDPGISAADDGKKARPEFEAAMRDLADRTIDVLVIPSFDRLTRGLKTWVRIRAVLEASGGKIVSVADGDLDADSPLVSIRAVFAEDEIRRTSRRVTRWHEQRARDGRPVVSGQRPFGYATRDRSEVDEAEAEVIRTAAELLLAGRSLRSVVSWVNTVTTAPGGKAWHVWNFRAMLLSPGVAGLRFHHGVEVAQGQWEAILDRQTWEKVRARLNEKPKMGRPRLHLLSGLVRCGICGRPMNTAYAQGKRQYACHKYPGQANCGRVVVYAEPVEELVGERVLDRLDLTGLGGALRSLGDASADVAARELADAETARDELEGMFTSGAIRQDAFLRMHGPAEDRVEAARRTLRALAGKSALARHTDPEELRAWWYDPETPTEEKKELVAACLDRVVMMPSGPRMSRFDPERVVIPEEAWKV